MHVLAVNLNPILFHRFMPLFLCRPSPCFFYYITFAQNRLPFPSFSVVFPSFRPPLAPRVRVCFFPMPFAFFIFAFVRFVPPCFFCLPFSFPASPPLAFSFPPVFSCLLPLFSAPRIPFLSIHALLSLLFFFFYPTPFSPPPSSKLPPLFRWHIYFCFQCSIPNAHIPLSPIR